MSSHDEHAFYNPYHYVPFGEGKAKTTPYQDIIEGEDAFARHDKWSDEGKSGVLRCQLTLLSPTVTGNQHHPADGDGKVETVVEQYQSPRINDAAIAANSLKGMISSIAEALSNSALRVLDDDAYSVRQDVSEAISAMGMIERDYAGELCIRPLCRPNQTKNKSWDKLFISQLSQHEYQASGIESQAFVMGKPLVEHPSFHGVENRTFCYFPKNRQASGILSAEQFEMALDAREIDANDFTRGALYILDIPNKEDVPPGRKKERFVPFTEKHESASNLLPLSEEVEKTLNNTIDSRVVRQTENERKIDKFPFFPTGYQTGQKQPKGHSPLKEGDLIYFDLDEQGKVCRLSYSAIWRTAAQKKTFESFQQKNENLTPWGSNDRKELTPAEKLFGVVQSEKSESDTSSKNLAGRVRFSDATFVRNRETGQLKVTLGEMITLPKLAAPKPPSPALYFNDAPQQKSKYAKESKLSPTGRLKYYLPHRSNRPDITRTKEPQWQTTLPQTNAADYAKNRDLHMQATPMAAGQTFAFEVKFDNLSAAELGLLLCALKPSKEFVHRIGLGKPYGLGQIDIQVQQVQLIDRQKRYQSFAKDTPQYAENWQAEQDIEHKLQLLLDHGGLVDATVLAGLQYLGNPNNQKANTPVCYPFSQNIGKRDKGPQAPYSEQELFKWFTENYDQRKYQYQTLASLDHLQPAKPGCANWLAAETLPTSLEQTELSTFTAQHQKLQKRK